MHTHPTKLVLLPGLVSLGLVSAANIPLVVLALPVPTPTQHMAGASQHRLGLLQVYYDVLFTFIYQAEP